MSARENAERKPMRRVVTWPWACRVRDNPKRAPPNMATNRRRFIIENPRLRNARVEAPIRHVGAVCSQFRATPPCSVRPLWRAWCYDWSWPTAAFRDWHRKADLRRHAQFIYWLLGQTLGTAALGQKEPHGRFAESGRPVAVA